MTESNVSQGGAREIGKGIGITRKATLGRLALIQTSVASMVVAIGIETEISGESVVAAKVWKMEVTGGEKKKIGALVMETG